MSRSLEASNSRSRPLSALSLAPLLLAGLMGWAAPAAAGCEGFLPDFDASCQRAARPAGGISPMSMPYLFEDPYITTGLQFATIWHDSPNNSVFKGGEATVLALQMRLAITDRLAFIATKDGYTIFRPDLKIGDIDPAVRAALGLLPSQDGDPLLKDEEDIFDITAGFKYQLIRWEGDGQQFVLTPSLRYEIPLGANDLFQANGDGVFIPAASVGWSRNALHAIADLGAQIPIDGDKNSTSIFYNLHLSYSVDMGQGRYFVPFIDFNGMHWTASGDGSTMISTTIGKLPLSTVQAVLGTGAFEGADVANLGSPGISGENLNTMAWGFRVLMGPQVSIGLSYERAISDRKDIFRQRVSVMASYEF